jgi:uncharacterized membrane protein
MPLIKRHILKSITYRILGTLTTIVLTLLAGLEIKWAAMVGIGEIIIKPIVYFLHERAWYKWIKYGLKNKN